MKKGLTFFLLGLAIWSCEIPQAQKVYTSDRQFRTTDPSRLYFKNIRSMDYYNRRKPNTKIDLYTFRKFSQDTTRPILYPMIVNNWLQDEAYIFIEKNGYSGFSDSLIISWKTETEDGQFAIGLFNKPMQYEFTGELYERLLNNEILFLKNKTGSLVPVFHNRADRLYFMTTMRDYYRLTEVF